MRLIRLSRAFRKLHIFSAMSVSTRNSISSSRNFWHTFHDRLHQQYGIRLPDCLELLIWSLGLALMVSLTLKDSLLLLSEYMDNNMAVQVQVILMDEKFIPPQLVVALPRENIRNVDDDVLKNLAKYLYNGNNCTGDCHVTECHVCKALTNVTWDVWNDKTRMKGPHSDLASFQNALSLAFFHRLIGNTSGEDVLQGNQSWNEVILYSVLNYLEWRCLSDYLLRTPDPAFGMDNGLHPGPDFLQDISDRDRKIDQLSARVLRGLCRKITFKEFDIPDEYKPEIESNKSCIDLFFDAPAPVIWDMAAIWIPLPRLPAPVRKSYTFRFTRNNPSNISYPVSIFPDTGILYTTLIDGTSYSYLFRTPVQSRPMKQEVTIRYKVQMRAKETRPGISCHNSTSVASCFPKCAKDWVIQTCQCIPFNTRTTFRKNHMDLPYCNLTAYAACNITELPAEVKDSCTKKCQVACEYTSYTWQVGYESQEGTSSEFTLKMAPIFDTFSEFTWTTKNTPEQFFSQLAGVGNFYLGFSGLSIFAVIIGLISWCKRYSLLRWKGSTVGIESDGKPWKAGRWAVKSSDQKPQNQANGMDEKWISQLKESLKHEIATDVLLKLGTCREGCTKDESNRRKGYPVKVIE